MSIKMRAKMRVGAIIPSYPGQDGPTEVLTLFAVAKNGGYPSDGADEDNSYARWSPSAKLDLHIANPALVGTFSIGETFYVDFTPVSAA